MKKKLNSIIVGLNYVLIAAGVLFIVLVYNFHDVEAYQQTYSIISGILVVSIPLSIILSIIYFIKKRNKRNFAILIFSIIQIAYVITYVFYILFVVATNL